jgi:hypothetical protein
MLQQGFYILINVAYQFSMNLFAVNISKTMHYIFFRYVDLKNFQFWYFTSNNIASVDDLF